MRHGLFTYPWDVEDGGIDGVCSEIADAGFSTVNVATQYHAGKFLLPRNPRRRVIFPEDGAVYFAADLSRFGRLTPRLHSTCDAGGGPIDRIVPALERHGLTYTAWTVCLHNSWLGEQHPDCCMTTAFGDPMIHSLSPAHPDVQEYLITLLTDLVRRCPVTDIQLESPGYMGFTHGYHHEIIGLELSSAQETALGLSFSATEIKLATADGIDASRARRITAEWLDGSLNGRTVDDFLADDDVVAYRDWMRAQETSLLKKVREAVHDANPDVRIWHFAALDGSARDNEMIATGDGILCGYASSDDDAGDRVRRASSHGQPARGAIRAIAPDTVDPSTIDARTAAWTAAGVDGIDVYNYGLMNGSSWDAVRDAIRHGD